MYEKAVEIDPSYGRAHALLAFAVSLEWFNDQGDSDALLNQALELAKKAVALDPNDNVCQVILGWVHLFRRFFDLAEQHCLYGGVTHIPGEIRRSNWVV